MITCPSGTTVPFPNARENGHLFLTISLVAAKIPEGVIREMLSEVRADGARDPARLFTYKIQRYALVKQKR